MVARPGGCGRCEPSRRGCGHRRRRRGAHGVRRRGTGHAREPHPHRHFAVFAPDLEVDPVAGPPLTGVMRMPTTRPWRSSNAPPATHGWITALLSMRPLMVVPPPATRPSSDDTMPALTHDVPVESAPTA